MSATVQVIAHQGGWDEILMVAAPLALEPPDPEG